MYIWFKNKYKYKCKNKYKYKNKYNNYNVYYFTYNKWYKVSDI